MSIWDRLKSRKKRLLESWLAITNQDFAQHTLTLPEKFTANSFEKIQVPEIDEASWKHVIGKGADCVDQMHSTDFRRGNRQRFIFNENSIVDIVNKQNVNKSTTLYWHTHSDNLRQLQTYGLTRTETLTGQVVEKLGQYKLLALVRRVEVNRVSDLDAAKQGIVDDAIERVRLYEDLELVINAGNPHKGTRFNIQEIQTKIDALVNQLQTRKTFLLSDEAKTKYAESISIEKNYISFLQAQYQREIERLGAYQKILQTILTEGKYEVYSSTNKADNARRTEKWLKRNVYVHLQEVLRRRLNDIVEDAKEQNEAITWKRLNRGKLSNYLIDADYVLTNYEFDQHQGATEKHQLKFGDKSERVIYNSEQHRITSKSKLDHLALAVDAITNPEQYASANYKTSMFVATPDFLLKTVDWAEAKYKRWQRKRKKAKQQTAANKDSDTKSLDSTLSEGVNLRADYLIPFLKVFARAFLYIVNFFVVALADNNGIERHVIDKYLLLEGEKEVLPDPEELNQAGVSNHELMVERMGITHASWSSWLGHGFFSFLWEHVFSIFKEDIPSLIYGFLNETRKLFVIDIKQGWAAKDYPTDENQIKKLEQAKKQFSLQLAESWLQFQEQHLTYLNRVNNQHLYGESSTTDKDGIHQHVLTIRQQQLYLTRLDLALQKIESNTSDAPSVEALKTTFSESYKQLHFSNSIQMRLEKFFKYLNEDKKYTDRTDYLKPIQVAYQSEITLKLAEADYQFVGYNPRDIVSGLVNIVTEIIDFSRVGLFEKHPMVGLGVATGSVFTFGALISPAAVKSALLGMGVSRSHAAAFIAWAGKFSTFMIGTGKPAKIIGYRSYYAPAFSRYLHNVGAIIPLVFRLLASPFTGSAAPWRELTARFADLTALTVRASAKLLLVTANIGKTFCKNVSEVIFRSVFRLLTLTILPRDWYFGTKRVMYTGVDEAASYAREAERALSRTINRQMTKPNTTSSLLSELKTVRDAGGAIGPIEALAADNSGLLQPGNGRPSKSSLHSYQSAALIHALSRTGEALNESTQVSKDMLSNLPTHGP